MLGLFVFAIINACVSGDVNANRGLWVALGAALAQTAPHIRRSSTEPAHLLQHSAGGG